MQPLLPLVQREADTIWGKRQVISGGSAGYKGGGISVKGIFDPKHQEDVHRGTPEGGGVYLLLATRHMGSLSSTRKVMMVET